MKHYADELISELVPNTRIKRFLTNTAVIGAYAENTVIEFVRRMVDPLRVSTGAVISPELVSAEPEIPQIDVIIWQPNPLPSIFTSGDFGLIPRMSVMGILEVKRSAYSGIGAKIKKILDAEDQLTSPVTLILNSKKVFSSLGVVCVRETKISDTPLENLISDGRVVVLCEIDVAGNITPNPSHIMQLVNYLVTLRMKAKIADGAIQIDIGSLEKK